MTEEYNNTKMVENAQQHLTDRFDPSSWNNTQLEKKRENEKNILNQESEKNGLNEIAKKVNRPGDGIGRRAGFRSL